MKFTKAVLGLSIALSLILASIPEEVSAQCPMPGCYGGRSTSLTYCTCSGYYWMVFTPLYIYGVPTPMAGALAVPPAVSFPNYATAPSQQFIGAYVPGVQACYMYAVYGCFPLPTYGMVLPYSGVSTPGAQ